MADAAAPSRDYRDTVFLPETHFPMRAGLPRLEPEILERWRKQGREAAALEELAAAPGEFRDDPAELLIREEQEAAFMKLLSRLPVAQRSVLLLQAASATAATVTAAAAAPRRRDRVAGK